MAKTIENNLGHIFNNHEKYTLIGHRICPYVQRVVAVLNENGFSYKKVDVDIDSKPDWIHRVSPTLKVPVLILEGEYPIFESSVICDYLDSMGDKPLYSADRLNQQ